MADSWLLASPLVVASQYASDAFGQHDAAMHPYATPATLASSWMYGDFDESQIISVTTKTLTGYEVKAYRYDFYYRIHISPASIDVGNILSDQLLNITVWNAFDTVQSLTGISRTGDAGVTLNAPAAYPVAYSPMEYKVYQLQVSVVGTPILEAKFSFTFNSTSYYLGVMGNRVVLWPFAAQEGITEALEWKTNVIRSKSSEQRVALRKSPRCSLEYKHFMVDYEVTQARALAYGWSFRTFGVPYWPDVEPIGTVNLGATSVTVDTTTADYRVGEPIILWGSAFDYETLVIDSIVGNVVTFNIPTTKTVHNAYAIPVRYARSSGLKLSRGPNASTEASIEFSVVSNTDLSAGISLPTYKGYDILTDTMYYIGESTEEVIREVNTIDNGVGTVWVDPKYAQTDETFVVAWDCTTRSARRRVLNWLHSRKGRLKSFWLPANTYDLTLMADAAISSQSLIVQSIAYPLYYQARDLQVKLKNGTYVYLSVTGGSTQNGLDTLALDVPLSVNLTMSSIERISFMRKVRFNADRIEISHVNYSNCTIKVQATEVSA